MVKTMRNTKTVTLNFQVPEDLDTPSEVLERLKRLLLTGLVFRDRDIALDDLDRRLIRALVMES